MNSKKEEGVREEKERERERARERDREKGKLSFGAPKRQRLTRPSHPIPTCDAPFDIYIPR